MARSSIAALVARAVRHRALSRRASPSLNSTRAPYNAPAMWASSLQLRAPFSAAAKGGKKKLPSLVILDAFDLEDDQETDEIEREDGDISFDFEMEESDDQPQAESDAETPTELSADEKMAITSSFFFAMTKKKDWMGTLAETNAFDTLLRVVYECYEPLYFTHPRLACEESMIVKSYADPSAVASVATRFRPKWYDDRVTKITESEAIALFIRAGRPDLALAVYHHREWIAATIGSVTLTSKDMITGDRTVDLTKHYRSYYSFAMGAMAALGDHSGVFSTYETALESGVFPTTNMTQTYLYSLVKKREYAAVLALYEQIQKDERPVNKYFYRQMLFVARVQSNGTIMKQLVDEMKIKGFKLRPEDYLNAVRSLDDDYYYNTTTSSSSSGRKSLPVETYLDSLARIQDQDANPAKYAKMEAACELVLQLFDEMVDDELLAPTQWTLFPRVITAATLLHRYERMNDIMALYTQVFKDPAGDPAMLSMASNAYLLQGEPRAAWELAVHAKVPSAGSHKNNFVHPINNVVQYIMRRQSASLTQELLAFLDSRKLLGSNAVVTLQHLATLLQVLVQDTETINDSKLQDIIHEKYWYAFPTSASVQWLVTYVDECVAANRWAPIAKALHQRSRKKIPLVPGPLAMLISERALAGPFQREPLELVTRLPVMTDLESLSTAEKTDLFCNVIRANHRLHADDVHVSSRKTREREIRNIKRNHLPLGVDIPDDVQAILKTTRYQ